MTLRISRCSAHARWMLDTRRGPTPGASVRRSGSSSMTLRVSSPKRSTSRPASTGPIPLTRPDARYRRMALAAGRKQGVIAADLKLVAMAGMIDPPAPEKQPFTGLDTGHRSDHCHKVVLPGNLQAADGEPRLFGAVDEPLDFAL